MAKSDTQSEPPGKKSDAKKSSESEKSGSEESEFVDVIAETGDQVDPPPPEVVEPDPEMSP